MVTKLQREKTSFYEIHQKKQAKLVDFNGWILPVQYKGIIEEVKATREKAGIFDVSHMGEILVEGRKAVDNLQYLLSNDVTKLSPGKCQYTFMLNENGGVIDDLLVYRLDEAKFWLIVNAANINKDFNWINQVIDDEQCKIEDISTKVSQLALQGPKSVQILERALDKDLSNLRYFNFINLEFDGKEVLVSRTGYTGEDGFEIYHPPEISEDIWKEIENVGKEYGLMPAGLGARDVLRLEASLPLYGNELLETITPLEAGLKPFIKFNTSFIGKESLEMQLEKGLKRKLIGFKLKDKRVPRNGFELYHKGEKIGFVTSGSFSPTLDEPIGMGYIDTEHKEEAEKGMELEVKIRKNFKVANITKMPFYRRGSK
ncbi:glycine cleavage system aminomethyltransferase GcvT [Natranaerofaba carboxydovora]|uniref:glycine cleavage system aminomethyltransferase GcvT n=1 Tax=Natranaerofaba carboxydovora TaxID=2742683 RepID=UPI001F136A27|nr:glycine cleavage system aminomethyltransferase GcvT [Natranaerofaba carboxydovora]UMZ74302.1 Aminomethyltransferase [Natranaerofaba carboxydovora]